VLFWTLSFIFAHKEVAMCCPQKLIKASFCQFIAIPKIRNVRFLEKPIGGICWEFSNDLTTNVKSGRIIPRHAREIKQNQWRRYLVNVTLIWFTFTRMVQYYSYRRHIRNAIVMKFSANDANWFVYKTYISDFRYFNNRQYDTFINFSGQHFVASLRVDMKLKV